MVMKGEAKFGELCSFLRTTKVHRIYLIHEPYREQETRRFAEQLSKQGFIPLIAEDFRKWGEKAVEKAIASSDFALVVAFDDETVKKCNDGGVAVFQLNTKPQRSVQKR